MSIPTVLNDFLVEAGVALVVGLSGIIIENKLHIINIIKKYYCVIINKKGKITLKLEYSKKQELKPEYSKKQDFEYIKVKFKNYFRNKKDFEVINETKTVFDFKYGIIYIKLIDTPDDTIYIKMSEGCGIRDLKKDAEEFISDLSEFDKINSNNIFGSFNYCEITLLLPYVWRYIDISKHKHFSLNSYCVNLTEQNNFKSEIEIKMNKIGATTSSKEAIIPLLGKLL